MKNSSKTKTVLRTIKSSLDKRRRAVFTKKDLQEIVIENLSNVSENQRAILKGTILQYLWDNEMLNEVVFEFPSRKEARYLFGNITKLELAQSLKPNAYLCHRAAMFVNGLCDDEPEIIYINVEQSQHHKRSSGSLTQFGFDQAFRNKPRVSNEIAEAYDTRVCITHGQRTDQLGVETKTGMVGESLRVTGIERTLIDIAVRPIYAGGPEEVLKAYEKAANIVSIEKLETMLSKMNFVYPYHQAIGFYLFASKAYSNEAIRPFEKKSREFDFYLDYKMKDPEYSKEWRIHYPPGLIQM